MIIITKINCYNGKKLQNKNSFNTFFCDFGVTLIIKTSNNPHFVPLYCHLWSGYWRFMSTF